MFMSKDLLVFFFKYLLTIGFTKYGICAASNQTIRLSTIAPYLPNANVAKNLSAVPTQQTSDTFLFGDAIVPPAHKDVYVSPFSKPQLNEQLLPIIGAKVREHVEGFLEDVDDGIDFIKNIFTAKQKVVKNLAFKVKNRIPLVQPLVGAGDPRYKMPDFTPTITTRIRINTKKPYYRYAKTGAISHICDDPIKCEKKQEWPKFVNEISSNGIKELEDSVLKKLEKIEEKKVEATLKRESDVIKGKPYGFQNEWKPVSYQNQFLDTKGSGSYKVRNQLHTSFKGSSSPIQVVGPSDPYPASSDEKIYKNSRKGKNMQKSAKVKIYPSKSYGSIQEIIASTTTNNEPLYDNHITHKKPETDFKPMIYQDDSNIDASEDKSKNQQQKQRKISRSTIKPSTTTTRKTATTSERSSFRWPRVTSSVSDNSVSPSESKKTFASIRPQIKRPLAERFVSTTAPATGSSTSDSLSIPAPTKSAFVDRVRKTGFRGKIKFNSVLNEKS